MQGEDSPTAHDSASEDDDDDDAGSVSGSVVSTSTPKPATQIDGEDFFDANETMTRRKAGAEDGAVRMVAGADAENGAAVPEEAAKSGQSGLATPQWLQEAQPVARRERLPEPAETQKSVSLWAIIKECIGKDLTRICLPVFFNEPLSALQKMAEEFEYSDLMERAAAAGKGSPERLLWVAVFAISGCAPPL